MLLEDHWAVSSFARGHYPDLAAKGVVCHAGDLADPAAVDKALRGADVVFHVAAKAGAWGNYASYYATNVTGTKNVIDACRRNGVKKLVHTSTPSVVFSGHRLENSDETVPYARRHLCHYSSTKTEAERLVLSANGPYLATVALRPHMIWGPGDNQIFPRLVKRHRAKRLMLIGSGDNLVDSTFVDNAARAHLDAAGRLEPGSPAAGRAYFISQGDPRPLGSLLNALLGAAGLPPVERSLPVFAASALARLLEAFYRLFRIEEEPVLTLFLVQQMSSAHYFDISAARRDLGYNPQISIEEGMEKFRLALSGSEVLAAHA
jgi:nucleoside-diphosphate-sugar epimerase